MSDILLTTQAAASATPALGRVVIYPKNDGYLYFKNDTGVETRVNPQTVATAAEWTAANPILAAGVFGVESDTMKFKIGDGVTAWNSLAYWRYTAEHITINTTGGNTVLTIPQSRASSMAVTGALISNVNIIVPDVMALFVAENLTTGAFTVTFKTAAGTGVEVAQGSHAILYADRVNVEAPTTVGSVMVTSRYIGNSSDLDTALGNLDDSQVAQNDSGFSSWGGAGNYYSIATNQLTLLRPGVGFIKGKKVAWAGSQTAAVFTANAAHWIYIDNTGTIGIATSRSATLYTDNIVLFEVHYDGTDYEVVIENHSVAFDMDTQEFLHETVGTVLIPVTGSSTTGADMTRVATGTGASADDRRIKIVGAARINDHGLKTTIPDSAGAAITWKFYYTNGSGNWVELSASSEFPMQYNNAGTMTALATSGGTDTGLWTCYAVKAEPNSGNPIYIAVAHNAAMGTNADALAAISAGSNVIASTTLHAALEPAQLGHVIVTNNASGGYISTVNIAKTTLRSVQSGGGSTAASGISTNTSNFLGGLSAADSNVQTALETLDKLERLATPIASAATTDLSTTNGNYVHVTGSVTITSFGTHSAGHLFQLVFDAAPLITHNGSTLILPGAANIQAAAGDVMIIRSEGSGTTGSSGNIWRCIAYSPAAGVIASNVANTPAGNISAVTVQAAINELDTEKAALAGSASQAFSAVTAAAGTNTTQVATTAYADRLTAGTLKAGFTDIAISAVSATLPALSYVAACFHLAKDDSDKGAWRKRKGQSWRSETRYTGRYSGASYASATAAYSAGLTGSGKTGDIYYQTGGTTGFYAMTGVNTSTIIYRAGREDYPTNALITAEAQRLIIWDLDGAQPSMWKVFPSTFLGGGTCTSVAVKDGYIAAGFSSTVAVVMMHRDSVEEHFSASAYYINQLGNVITYTAVRLDALGLIVNNTVNDVAITVLPDAPLDEYGMPIPTIAAATAGGASVIKDDGTVVNSGSTAAHSKVEFDRMGKVVSCLSAGGANFRRSFYPARSLPALWTVEALSTATTPALASGMGNLTALLPNAAAGVGLTVMAWNHAAFALSMVAHITSTYNTGWMVGDIRRAIGYDSASALADKCVKAGSPVEVGTLTKTPVSGGRTAVSGFSNANYIQEPTHADFNAMGTGGFDGIVPGAKWGTAATLKTILSVGDGASNGSLKLEHLAANTLRLSIYNAGWTTICTSTATFTDTAEHELEFNRGTFGGVANTCQIIVDGVVVASGVSALTISNATGYLRIGEGQDASQPWTGGQYSGYARISATAPTAEQSKYIAAKENALNGGNACLLSNSSTVSDLSYDKDTDTYLVGNGTNVDTFQGLKRIASQAHGVITLTGLASINGRKLIAGTGATYAAPERNVSAELLEAQVTVPKEQQYSFTTPAATTTQALPKGWKARGIAFNTTDGTFLGTYTQAFDGFIWILGGLTASKAYQINLVEDAK